MSSFTIWNPIYCTKNITYAKTPTNKPQNNKYLNLKNWFRLNKMSSELTDEIDKLFDKYTNDLKTRINKLIIRHEKKIVKDTARTFKSNQSNTVRRQRPLESDSRRAEGDDEDN